MDKQNKTAALTGHRPQRLGYDSNINHPDWYPIIDWIKKQIQKYEITFSKYSFAFFSFGIHKTQVIETIDNPNNIRLICQELYDWLNKFVSLYK